MALTSLNRMINYEPKGSDKPYVTGNRGWEYIYKPKGLKRLYKRPVIAYTHGFTYYYQGQYPIDILKGDRSDTFTFPWQLTLASLGFLDYIVEEIVWVSGVHDEACKRLMFTREVRADIFRECIWFAFKELKRRINKSDWPMPERVLRKILSKLRNFLLVFFVKAGSIAGYC